MTPSDGPAGVGGGQASGALRSAVAPAVRFAPAKLNLTLAVLRRMESGYHSLHSVMVPLDLTDALTVVLRRPESHASAAPPDADTLDVSGLDAGPQQGNLVLRAFDAARDAVGKTWPGSPADPPPLAARLVKRIPVAAGLGGGSSDAASAIDAALEVWDARLGAAQAMNLAARVGSDVPFFFAGGPALVTGRGEVVEPLTGIVGEAPGVLLVAPRVPVSTQAAFGALDAGVRPEIAGASRQASQHLAAELQRGLTAAQLVDRAAVMASANDLLPAAIAVAPAILPLRRALARLLGRPIGQSGSGPTIWVLYRTKDEAAEAARLVRAALRDGRLPETGTGDPLVVATSILNAGSAAEAASPEAPAAAPDTPDMPAVDAQSHSDAAVTNATTEPDPAGPAPLRDAAAADDSPGR